MTSSTYAMDEERQALVDGEGDQGSFPRVLQNKILWGTLCTASSALTIWIIIFNGFVHDKLWPVVCVLLVLGHWLLLRDDGSAASTGKILLMALVCEILATMGLGAAYWFPSFVVPWWWWHATVLMFLWPAMAMVSAVALVYFWDRFNRTSTPGLFFIGHICFMMSCILLFAGGTTVRDKVLAILPEGLNPPGYGEVVATESTTEVYGIPVCDLTKTKCDLDDLDLHQWTAVRTGNKTTCLVGDYMFRVHRGSSKKVLLLFEGGGSCWNWITYITLFCTQSIGFSTHGIFNMSDTKNPYRDYTVVDITYCSGDIFGGDAEHFWISPLVTASAWKRAAGYENTLAVLKWMESQFDRELLQSPLQHFVIAGESAGSLGVQVWAGNIMERFKGRYREKDTLFIADSFVGLMVGNSKSLQRMLIDYWGLCRSGVMTGTLEEKCKKNELIISDIVGASLQEYRGMRLSMILSKFDKIQILFGDLVKALSNLWTIFTHLASGSRSILHNVTFSKPDFYKELLEHVAPFAEYPHVSTYFVDTVEHGYITRQFDKLFRTTPAGTGDHCSNADVGMRLADWLNPNKEARPNQCYGIANATPWSGSYCSPLIQWEEGKCEK